MTLGVVDILAEDGKGEQAIIEYTKQNRKRFHAERAVYKARRLANPVTIDELLEITEMWAETALYLDEVDVRKMERLANAQERRIARSAQDCLATSLACCTITPLSVLPSSAISGSFKKALMK